MNKFVLILIFFVCNVCNGNEQARYHAARQIQAVARGNSVRHAVYVTIRCNKARNCEIIPSDQYITTYRPEHWEDIDFLVFLKINIIKVIMGLEDEIKAEIFPYDENIGQIIKKPNIEQITLEILKHLKDVDLYVNGKKRITALNEWISIRAEDLHTQFDKTDNKTVWYHFGLEPQLSCANAANHVIPHTDIPLRELRDFIE